ncbi:MAG: glycosyltransferase involved in cell wall biosynthesis [Candidatus Azotimanducaceae bacterium]|jgi:glycosyltransferase involved in cell wall biosynthesis
MVRKCDAIYALDSVSVGLPALLVSYLTRKPFLIRLGGDYAWEQGRIRFGLAMSLDEYTADTSGRPIMVRVLARIQSFVVCRAQLVIAPSEYLKKIISTWGVRTEKIKVVYSALFPLPVTETQEVLRKRLEYNGPVLITAARLTPWKGVSSLIEMVAKLEQEIPDLVLVVAGDGEAKESLERKAMELRVAHRVRFVGRLSKEALGAAIKGADAFVYNTSYEGLPHQLLEVMELGIPIVTTNIAGNREILTDGVHALLCDPNDLDSLSLAVKRILESEHLRTQLTQNARVRSREFSKEVVSKELTQILHEVIR